MQSALKTCVFCVCVPPVLDEGVPFSCPNTALVTSKENVLLSIDQEHMMSCRKVFVGKGIDRCE